MGWGWGFEGDCRNTVLSSSAAPATRLINPAPLLNHINPPPPAPPSSACEQPPLGPWAFAHASTVKLAQASRRNQHSASSDANTRQCCSVTVRSRDADRDTADGKEAKMPAQVTVQTPRELATRTCSSVFEAFLIHA